MSDLNLFMLVSTPSGTERMQAARFHTCAIHVGGGLHRDGVASPLLPGDR